MSRLFILGLSLLILSQFITLVSAQVVINEVSPFSDTEWVELYNASESAEYLKTYFLDDDASFESDEKSKDKKSLAGINLSNTTYPVFEGFSAFFNNPGDTVVLFDANGNIKDQYIYSENYGDNLTFGRNPDQTGSFVLLESATKGSKNSGIKASPNPTPSISPTPKPSVSPSVTPSPISTSSPSPKPTPKPTPKRSSSLPQPNEEVLGIQELASSPIAQLTTQPELPAANTPASFPTGIVVIIIGLTISGAGGYWAYRLHYKKV